jgi:hypothetical protein
MVGRAEQKQYHSTFSETTETRLKDVFESYEKLERELLQHIEQLRLAGWLEAGNEFEVGAEPAEYSEDGVDTGYLLR